MQIWNSSNGVLYCRTALAAVSIHASDCSLTIAKLWLALFRTVEWRGILASLKFLVTTGRNQINIFILQTPMPTKFCQNSFNKISILSKSLFLLISQYIFDNWSWCTTLKSALSLRSEYLQFYGHIHFRRYFDEYCFKNTYKAFDKCLQYMIKLFQKSKQGYMKQLLVLGLLSNPGRAACPCTNELY